MTRAAPTALGLLIAAARCGAQAAEVTTVRITDKVLVKDTIRLGINTCGDNYWDSAIVKTRVAENFEGVRYRMITWGPEQDVNGIAVWGPDLMNLVGVQPRQPFVMERDGRWPEAIAPRALRPQNLYEAQLERRLSR